MLTLVLLVVVAKYFQKFLLKLLVDLDECRNFFISIIKHHLELISFMFFFRVVCAFGGAHQLLFNHILELLISVVKFYLLLLNVFVSP